MIEAFPAAQLRHWGLPFTQYSGPTGHVNRAAIVDVNLCQEDWGVVFFARRNQKKFWIGLSAWDSDGAWLAHFHHGSFAWLQWFSSRGNDELERLLADVHKVLVSEPAITDIAWHEESDMSKPEPVGFPTPV